MGIFYLCLMLRICRKKLENMNCNPSISKVTDGMVSRMVWDGISGPKACVPHTLTANIEPMIPNAIMMEPITNPFSRVNLLRILLLLFSAGIIPEFVA